MKYPDLTAPDASDVLLTEITELGQQITPMFHVLRDKLPPDLEAELLVLWNLNQRAMQLQGARKAVGVLATHGRLLNDTPQQLEVLRGRIRNQAATLAQVQPKLERLKTLEEEVKRLRSPRPSPAPRPQPEAVTRLNAQIAAQNQEIRNLKWQLLQALRGEHPQQTAVPDAPTEDAPRPAPTWDYKPAERRRPRRDEVVTETPFAVEVVARQVEEYVKRQGRCTKPDVSEAHPDLRPYLTTAYRHLHESRRVRVDGWTLEVWGKE